MALDLVGGRESQLWSSIASVAFIVKGQEGVGQGTLVFDAVSMVGWTDEQGKHALAMRLRRFSAKRLYRPSRASDAEAVQADQPHSHRHRYHRRACLP